jgi:hypothetical protein
MPWMAVFSIYSGRGVLHIFRRQKEAVESGLCPNDEDNSDDGLFARSSLPAAAQIPKISARRVHFPPSARQGPCLEDCDP